ncbi:complex 1 protein-domain-containing protein [Polychytrium aggregatum]|uniref:complex 1 protein-domain-containing protein n=1 Tax=Polychytrium aggregatum TaxID=110093 RepID=UPI0022FEA732|nr:complex 1 protein-domain-containing protein [Polychytrium aggregatum]KAI9203622.1 complex 1 protein-domain-containing protein [Polychytrium aggregatum]
MSSAAPSRTAVLSLYRSFIRTAKQFKSYNYSQYVQRRARDTFREHMNETDAIRIAALYQRGISDLEIAKRQAWVNSHFGSGNLVVESQHHRVHHA